MTAVEVGKARPGSVPLQRAPVVKRRAPWLGYVVGFLVFGGALAVALHFYGDKLWRRDATELNESELRFKHKLENPPIPKWSLDLAEAFIPNRSLAGSVSGHEFTCEKAYLRNTNLLFRQGTGWPPDLGVTISFLSEITNETSIQVASTQENLIPRIILRSKDERQRPVSKAYLSGYVLKFSVEQVTTNSVSGRIYLATPDDDRSFVSGTFEAEIVKSPSRRSAVRRVTR
jgi:hypothetical protein